MSPTIAERLASAAKALEPISDSPALDAEYLMAHALGTTRARLALRRNERPELPEFDALLQRRLASEPIPYILGVWEFFSIELKVRAPMLVPRPETEHLVEVVIAEIGKAPVRVLELGVGTGCVSLAIAKGAPNATITGTDINPAAIVLTRENVALHGLDARVTLHEGDLFDALPDGTAAYHVICSNPPYIESGDWDELSPSIRNYEDVGALLSGPDGLGHIRRIVAEAPRWLLPGGLLAFEIGMGQHVPVRTLLEQHGYTGVAMVNDLAGIPRIACGKRPS